MTKKHKILNPTKEELLAYERELLGINLTSIMGNSKLKIKTNGYNGLVDLKRALESSENTQNMLVAGKIKSFEFKQSKAGNFFYWIELIDDICSFKIYCNLNDFKKFSTELIKGKTSLFRFNIKDGFAKFDKCILIDNIPFKSGYIFVIHLPFNIYSTAILEYIEDNIDVTIRRGNVQVFQNTRPNELFIDPTYDLIDKINEIFKIKCSLELEDEFIWGKSNKYLKYMEENGY